MSFKSILSLWVAISFLLLSSCKPVAPVQPSAENMYVEDNAANNVMALVTGFLYDQPVNPNGKLLLSSWLDPDGSDSDQYVWDDFKLPSNETITDINWYGVYDPLKFGAGGPVLDFRVRIYPSILAGTERNRRSRTRL